MEPTAHPFGKGPSSESSNPSGYTPRLGVFTISPDKRSAQLEFDTTQLPNGTLQARISAFDVAAGAQGATEQVAMPTRTWRLSNTPEPAPERIPDASYMPQVYLSFYNLPRIDPQPIEALRRLDDATFADRLVNDWPSVESVFRQYIPANVELVPPTPRGFVGPWGACMDAPALLACKEVVLYLSNLMSDDNEQVPPPPPPEPEPPLDDPPSSSPTTPSPTPDPVPVPDNQFIESWIQGEFRGFNAGNTYRLTNGQVWMQAEIYTQNHYAYMPRVTLRPNPDHLDRYLLQVEGISYPVSVERIQ